jgi:hypothetical protein
MTDDAVRYLRSGDGQGRVSSRRIWPLGRVGAGDYRGCAATIVTVHEFRRVGRTPWSRLGASATVMRSKRRGAAAPP